MTKQTLFGIVAVMALGLSGCGGPSNKPVTSGSTSAASPSIASDPSSAKVVDGPPSSAGQIPAQGIVIKTDPNDPKFKPAPGMMGGGDDEFKFIG